MAGFPEFVEKCEFLEGVHGLPEALMEVGAELAVAGEIFHGGLFEHYGGVGGEVVEDFAVADHVASVDEAAFCLGFFVESGDGAFGFDAELAEAAWWVDGCEGADFVGLGVEGDGGGDINVADAVAVGEEKVGVVADVFFDEFDAVGGHGIFAGFGECDFPVFFGVVGMEGDVWCASEGEGGVAGVPEVVAEVVADHVAFVAEAKDEIFEAVVGVGFHDVP